MARYSRRRGPTANYDMTGSFALVPGMTISRSFGRGTLLVCGHLRFSCIIVAGSLARFQAFLDGAGLGGSFGAITLANNDFRTGGFCILEPILPGLHTIELRVRGDAAAGDLVDAGSAELVVIELPEWDEDDDLITL